MCMFGAKTRQEMKKILHTLNLFYVEVRVFPRILGLETSEAKKP